eukprot:CAMPEP_0179339326 /NCGR_PEP_ID=MMETSP0797-20121207/68650_1 /TAXON_ID=47934 /ORGANISM="Dinophysis acuminata, Strain DAEP01" /LENGTH=69 /DNA_ID=CAMNT_0021053139 /DNA_START=1 /DNA_END=207 /DNA_ORIENTATION=+
MLGILGVLRQVPMTMQCLRETGIGRTITALRCYNERAQALAGPLITAWKDRLRTQVRAEQAVATRTVAS